MSDNSITNDFKQFILDKFSSKEDDDSGNKVFFEGLGHPITENDLTDYSFSSLVNVYPDTDSENFIHNVQKLDDLYKIVLNGSTPLPDLDGTLFNTTKASALQDLESYSFAPPNATTKLYLKSDQFPNDWFNDKQYWNTYRPGKKTNDLVIKTLKNEQDADPLENGNFNLDLSKRISLTRKSDVHGNNPTTSQVDVSLEYCLVEIHRNWLSTTLLNLFDNWYLPNYSEGHLAVDPIDFQYLPTAMIVVREVEIRADWTDKDRNVLAAANSLGLFSMVGGEVSVDQGRVSNPQTQIIGWICTPIKKLPPASDPTIQNNGYITIKHAGWYVARFIVSWKEKDQNGNYIDKEWKSGNKTMGYDYKLTLPAKSKNIVIKGWAATGLVWDKWNQIMVIDEPKPTNKTYKVTGTTLNNKCKVS